MFLPSAVVVRAKDARSAKPSRMSPGIAVSAIPGVHEQARRSITLIVVPEIPQQRGPASASRPGLQPRQLHADAGLAEGGGALVSDHAQGEADQDWCQGREPRPVRHFPTGGGCGAEGAVPKNPPPHRWAAAGPCAAVTTAHPVAIPAARQDRCVLRRSKCALAMRSGHRVGLLITKSARSSADYSLS